MKLRTAAILGAAFFFTAASAVFSAEANRKILPGHVPAVTARLISTGRLPATNQLHLAIGLPLRDPAGLEKFLAEVSDPASPNYRKFLTPEEFTARFGPTEADYAAVKEFARTNGLAVTGTFGNRLVLDVTGPASAVEKAFHLSLRVYRHPTEARDFFAPDAEPTVDAALPVTDIQGLSDFSRPHPNSHRLDSSAGALPKSGSAPDGYSFIGNDFRNAYAPGTVLTGAGQMVGLLQFDGFYSNDIAAYATAAGGGRTNIVIQTIKLDGFNGTPGAANSEVSLDIEMAMAMAPGLAKIVVFEAASATYANDILNAMVTNSAIKNLSSSWGWTWIGGTATTETIFMTMAAQGQSFFNASGDGDAFATGSANDVNNPNQTTYPSGSPNITVVGGTYLTMNGLGATYAAETNWNDNTANPNGGYWGSSGGISTNAIPYWQTNIVSITNGTSKGSTTQRNIPDVALTAKYCYAVYSNGVSGSFRGTSCAAPLWAGFTALMNQQAALAGQSPVGFLNPAIYAIGKSANYTNCFHDITVGNNFWPSSPANFPAVTGYDLCTGWGTPNGARLINALAGPPAISPLTGFAATGAVGGPFSPAAFFFSLTNSSASNLVWSFVNTSAWLNVSAASGTLAPDNASNVIVSLSAAANSLAAGVYGTTLVFTNRNTATAVNFPFQLSIGQSLVQNGGFELGTSLPDWTLNGNSGDNFVDNGSVITPHTGTYDFSLSQVGSLAYLSQSLATVPGQGYLLSFWLTNTVSGNAQNLEQFMVNWNTNSTTTNSVLNLTNPPALGWSNFLFVVTATSTNTTLQFAGRNDPGYFGIDDVSVTPIPTPTFITFSKKTNSFSLTWNALAGVAYQVQYQTNLLKTNWIILATNTAVASTLTFSNTIGTDPQRFYRVRRLP
jgi:subtilase family serine protease